MKSKTERWLAWISFNSLFAYFVYDAIWNRDAVSESIAVGIICLTGFSALALLSKKATEEIMKELSPVPRQLDALFDLSILAMMYIGAWYWMMGVYFFHMFFFQKVWKEAKRKEAESAA